jgi:putative transposase
MYGYRRQGKFQLHAFVLMPDHVHMLLTPAKDVTLERSLQLLKGGYSHAFGAEFGKHKEVWQRGFNDHRIRDHWDFEQHRQYIHNNPVVRRIVDRAVDYRYSSAYPGYKLDQPALAAKAAVA